jgi:hypothetical protein
MASSTLSKFLSSNDMLDRLPGSRKKNLISQHYDRVKAAFRDHLESEIATNQAKLKAMDTIVPASTQKTHENSTSHSTTKKTIEETFLV